MLRVTHRNLRSSLGHVPISLSAALERSVQQGTRTNSVLNVLLESSELSGSLAWPAAIAVNKYDEDLRAFLTWYQLGATLTDTQVEDLLRKLPRICWLAAPEEPAAPGGPAAPAVPGGPPGLFPPLFAPLGGPPGLFPRRLAPLGGAVAVVDPTRTILADFVMLILTSIPAIRLAGLSKQALCEAILGHLPEGIICPGCGYAVNNGSECSPVAAMWWRPCCSTSICTGCGYAVRDAAPADQVTPCCANSTCAECGAERFGAERYVSTPINVWKPFCTNIDCPLLRIDPDTNRKTGLITEYRNRLSPQAKAAFGYLWGSVAQALGKLFIILSPWSTQTDRELLKQALPQLPFFFAQEYTLYKQAIEGCTMLLKGDRICVETSAVDNIGPGVASWKGIAGSRKLQIEHMIPEPVAGAVDPEPVGSSAYYQIHPGLRHIYGNDHHYDNDDDEELPFPEQDFDGAPASPRPVLDYPDV